MTSSCRLRGGALIAAALTLAACGSDKAAGPTTANNPQIIAELRAAYDDANASETDQSTRLAALDFAITALTLGSPVTAGSVTIDGASYPVSLTSYSLEFENDQGVTSSISIVTGWRETNGDSLLVLVYSPPGGGLLALHDAAAPGVARLRAPRSLRLADLARMVRGGTVAKEVTSGNFDLQVAAFVADSGVWEAAGEDGVIHSGSASFSAASGECDQDGVDQLGDADNIISCELEKASFGASADLADIGSQDGEDRSLSVDAQSVTGVKVVSQAPPG